MWDLQYSHQCSREVHNEFQIFRSPVKPCILKHFQWLLSNQGKGLERGRHSTATYVCMTCWDRGGLAAGKEGD